MLHDPGRPLGAQHALIDRVVAIAFNITDFRFAVFACAQMDIDAASTCAHVTGCFSNFIGDMGRFLNLDCRHGHIDFQLDRRLSIVFQG